MSKDTTEYTVRCIAYGGGVVRGVAYPGFIKALEASGLRDSVEYVTGSSAGAIMAALTAIGATSAHLETMILNKDGNGLDLLQVFEPGNSKQNALLRAAEGVWNVLDHGGLSDGSYLCDKLNEQIDFSSPAHRIRTFRDLHEAREAELREGSTRLLKLYIPATNLSTSYKEVFSYETSPDVAIADAVRASATLPGGLTPVKIGDCFYADAGFSYDVPTTEFDYARFYSAEFDHKDHPHQYTHIYNDRTLACCFASAAEIKAFETGQRPPVVFSDITNDVALAEAWIAATYNATYVNVPREMDRTILIDNLGINSLDVTMDAATKQSLMNSAEDATNRFITARKSKQAFLHPKADLYEFKEADGGAVSIGGINSVTAVLGVTFAERVDAERAAKQKDSNCTML